LRGPAPQLMSMKRQGIFMKNKAVKGRTKNPPVHVRKRDDPTLGSPRKKGKLSSGVGEGSLGAQAEGDWDQKQEGTTKGGLVKNKVGATPVEVGGFKEPIRERRGYRLAMAWRE